MFSPDNLGVSPRSQKGATHFEEEINERNSKVNNVMMCTLNKSNSQSLNERILHDKAEVVKILDIKDIKENVIEKVIGVCKKGTKPKPRKIALSNSGIARTVLRNKSRIMESYGRNISVGPDQTVLQRTHLRRILGKLKQRERDGEKDLHVKLLDSVFSDIDSTVVGVASNLLVNNYSNHVALHMDVSFLAEIKRLDYRDVQFIFNRADYIGMNSFLGTCDWSVDNIDIDRTVCKFYNNVYATYRFIPLKTFAPSRYPKWFDSELIHMVRR
ncbi:hypothetical protein HHI36_023797 [Cryptolaemus montrouzieri]|uniref:Uncharacterized protein n=1 Tax=Cryptolaemus montrouzieri TaxID=559131 RepID=A0ABD2PJ33_9CUCU